MTNRIATILRPPGANDYRFLACQSLDEAESIQHVPRAPEPSRTTQLNIQRSAGVGHRDRGPCETGNIDQCCRRTRPVAAWRVDATHHGS
jgi:hypothetical protein